MEQHREIAENIKREAEGCYLCKSLDGKRGLCLSQKEIGLKYNYATKSRIKILFYCGISAKT